MFKKSPLLLVLMFTSVLPAPCLALDPETAQLTESDFFNEIPVVLTATRLKQSKKNSPIASTIIDRDMIEASGFTEIADLLRLAPGMLVNYDSGHIASVGYQFLFDRYRVRLQILVDGKSVYTPLFGEMPWTQLGITIDDIERIEVIRGPSSASYGPNAMTGVVSIITRHAALDKGARFKANQGVNGRSEQFATLGSNSGKFDYRLSLARRKDDGFEKRYDSKDLSIVNFRGDYRATDSDIITLSADHNAGNYHEDASDHLNDAMPQHTKKVSQTSVQTKWEHNYLDGDIFKLNYYQQTYNDINNYIGNFTADGYGYVPINEGVQTDRSNIEFSYTVASDNYNITFGALYRRDKTRAAQYLYNFNKYIDTQQFYINSESYLNEANIINIGLLQDKNDTAGKSISPRIALNHHFNKNQTARISYSESSRSPFALEEYTNRVIYVPLTTTSYTVWKDLSDLKAEKIKSFDIGYVGNFNNNATNIDARIYKNWLTDLIVQDWTLFTGGFLQGDAFNVTGFEATLSHKFNNSKVILNYALTTIKAVTLAYGKSVWYEKGAPNDSASLLITHDFGNNINSSLGYYYTGGYQQLCCEIQQQSIRNRVDITLSKTFKLDGHNSKINFVLQNITNEYVKTRLFNNYHRQGYISFSIEL